jgi:hypothetical protein
MAKLLGGLRLLRAQHLAVAHLDHASAGGPPPRARRYGVRVGEQAPVVRLDDGVAQDAEEGASPIASQAVNGVTRPSRSLCSTSHRQAGVGAGGQAQLRHNDQHDLVGAGLQQVVDDVAEISLPTTGNRDRACCACAAAGGASAGGRDQGFHVPPSFRMRSLSACARHGHGIDPGRGGK